MPPSRQSPLKRAAILAAALEEFEARGYRETSMDRIAARAGVSKRTVYNHFVSKEQLFEAIAAELIERVQEVSQRPYDPAQPLDAQLDEIGGHVLDMLASPSFLSLARVTLAELIRSPELARRTYSLFRARQTGLARWLADAVADGRLAVAEPERAADQFMGQLNAFALWPQLLGGQPVPDAAERARILEPAVAMLLWQYRQSD
jgi:TetR/AcrR family transcriptional regulator of autoinduction and epiphytic fitness